MVKENKSQEFRSKNKEEKNNYFIKKIDRNELISSKCKEGFYDSKLY